MTAPPREWVADEMGCLAVLVEKAAAQAAAKERPVRRKRVEFDAHKIVKKRTEVEFTTRDGTQVDFKAKKPVEKKVHVDFLAKPKEEIDCGMANNRAAAPTRVRGHESGRPQPQLGGRPHGAWAI